MRMIRLLSWWCCCYVTTNWTFANKTPWLTLCMAKKWLILQSEQMLLNLVINRFGDTICLQVDTNLSTFQHLGVKVARAIVKTHLLYPVLIQFVFSSSSRYGCVKCLNRIWHENNVHKCTMMTENRSDTHAHTTKSVCTHFTEKNRRRHLPGR